jgi:hypothetical protein
MSITIINGGYVVAIRAHGHQRVQFGIGIGWYFKIVARSERCIDHFFICQMASG